MGMAANLRRCAADDRKGKGGGMKRKARRGRHGEQAGRLFLTLEGLNGAVSIF